MSVPDPKLRQFQKFIAVEGLLSFALSTLRILRVNKEEREFLLVIAAKEHSHAMFFYGNFTAKQSMATEYTKELNVTSYSGTE